MSIETAIQFLNSRFGYKLNSEYYSNISVWKDWWKGTHKPFHRYRDHSGDKVIERDMYTLKMAKKIAEDWATLLLNEKTKIFVGEDDENKTTLEILIAFLDNNRFWQEANRLVETAFYSGTGAFVLQLNNIKLNNDSIVEADSETMLKICYLSAQQIIPISVIDGEIQEVAFVSEQLIKGVKYVYIEVHLLENDKYVIYNFLIHKDRGTIIDDELPSGIIKRFETGEKVPFFSIVSPSIVNSFENNNGLGMSIYAQAIDNLKGCDLSYNNFNRDFYLGGKKVFYNKRLIAQDANGKSIAPDDVCQQLFAYVDDDAMTPDDEKSLWKEFNPLLRVTENTDGIQAQLDFLSFKVGFGTKHYQFNSGTITTATQYTGDKQELIQHTQKHTLVLDRALKAFFHTILWAMQKYVGENIDLNADIKIDFDDGYIDKQSERTQDMLDVSAGLLMPYEYRMKWYGESADEAKAVIAENTKINNQWLGFEE